MFNWEKNLIDIEPYVPGEQPAGDIIKLNANENPYPPSERVASVIREFDAGNLRKYPDSNSSVLKKAIADYYSLDSANVSVGNGSDEVLAFIFLSCFCNEKPIFFPDITYSFYHVWARLFDKDFRQIPLDVDFCINPKDYHEDNGGVIIPNPNAPTGIGQGEGLLRDIIEGNTDRIVVVDEAYSDFGEYSAVNLLGEYENLIVVKTYSKSRSLAGQRIGFALASNRIIEKIEAVKNSFNSYTMDMLTLEIAKASLEDEAYFKECIDKVKKTRKEAAETLRKMGFVVMDSQSNFLFVSHPSVKAKRIFSELREKGIYVRYFDIPRLENWLRITVGTDDEMEKLLSEIRGII